MCIAEDYGFCVIHISALTVFMHPREMKIYIISLSFTNIKLAAEYY